jgi:hypothetical protein
VANFKVLPVFISIIFNKTNAFDSGTVIATMEITAKWFSEIHSNGDKIPASFDFNYFFKGIKMLIELDHAICGSKCIWLLYKTLHIFGGKLDS